MEKAKELKEIEQLKNAKMRTYTLDTFKQYWTHEDDYKSKRARVVHATYIVVYSLWHKRLLARVFYLEEYMKYKKITRKLFEVQRQVAGMSQKISQRIYRGRSMGFKVWTGSYGYGWSVGNATSHQLYGINDAWNGEEVVGFEQYNDPVKYLKQSIHKYSAVEFLPSNDYGHNEMFEYLLKYEKHPQIEMLAKMGLSHVIENLSGIRWSKQGIAMLGITKQELPYLQAGLTLQEYREIRDWCLKYKLSISEAEFAYRFYQVINYSPYHSRSEVDITFSPRLIRYLCNKDVSIYDYVDMIKAKQELGLPDENKYLYPEDFMAMHDFLNKQVQIKKSEELTKRIAERAKELMKLSIERNGMLIKPLLSQDELIEEGKKLHHCVGSYAQSVARGETAIYTIRRVDNPDKPLATLELRDKRVIQVRSDRNGVPSKDVQTFVKQWEKQYRLEGY